MIFDITGKDIEALGDDALRRLIVLLAEAEARSLGVSTGFVDGGGDQDARDGGIDVSVCFPAGTQGTPFLPCSSVIFQSKKSKTPPSKIAPEMCPAGHLRSSIAELEASHGAYIIVSAKDSTSDTARKARTVQMRSCLAGLGHPEQVTVDFFDQNKIASWVRNYPGIMVWISNRLGRYQEGWQPFECWVDEPDGLKANYLMDDSMKITCPQVLQGQAVTAASALESMREKLSAARSCIRLTGLSGVGKTRLVQELFAGPIGSASLPGEWAVYANVSSSPSPNPTAMAKRLVLNESRAVLVIDNCSSTLHHDLVEICRSPGSKLSLVTIEYDINEDLPEDTDAYELSSSSYGLIRTLLLRRRPHLSEDDCLRLADFSGGNARLALAIAAAVEVNETMASVSNSELVKRLLVQSKQHDEQLLRAAQSASLLYSFDGMTREGAYTELGALAALAQLSEAEFYRKVADLFDRKLVQARSEWRALLPQALANTLAKQALRAIHPAEIDKHLVQMEQPRVLRSLARRLGALHDSEEARQVVGKWLSATGFLGKIRDLGALGKEIFALVAPVAPEKTLEAIERGLGQLPQERLDVTFLAPILRGIAFNKNLFSRAALCISQLIDLVEERYVPTVTKHLLQLFAPRFSGTNASAEQRVRLVECHVRDPNLSPRFPDALAIEVFEMMLAMDSCRPFGSYHFGARPERFGLILNSVDQLQAWFTAALGLGQALLTCKPTLELKIRAILAAKFRSIWRYGFICPFFSATLVQLRTSRFDAGLWLAARACIEYDLGDPAAEDATRLLELERALAPRNLQERLASVIHKDSYSLHREHGEKSATLLTATSPPDPETLGRECARNFEIFSMLLPQLLTEGTDSREVGLGLALETEDLAACWQSIVKELHRQPKDGLRAWLVAGFLKGTATKDGRFAARILDQALDDEIMSTWFIDLQTQLPVTPRAISRVKAAISLRNLDLSGAFRLALWKDPAPMNSADFIEIALKILRREDGAKPALDLLVFRLKQFGADEIVLGGARSILETFVATKDFEEIDYDLSVVIGSCGADKAGELGVRNFCRRFLQDHYQGNRIRSGGLSEPEAM